MNRIAIGVIGALLSASPLAAPAFEAPGPACAPTPRQYLGPRVETAPVIDGALDDAAWEAAAWSEDFVDIAKQSRHRLPWRTNMKMCWDDEYLYVAGRLEEPHVWAKLTERDAVIYHDNDFEVFIDPDGDNHLYYELEINALGTEWDLLLVKPYRDGAPAVNAWDIQGLKTAVQVDGTINDPTTSDVGWNVEMAFPWAVLAQCAGRPAPPAVGDIWRMNFSRVQWWTDVSGGEYVKKIDRETGAPRPEENWVWSPQGLVAMHYPERWGEVMFRGVEADTLTVGELFAASGEHRSIADAATLMPYYYAQKKHHDEFGVFITDPDSLAAAVGECALPADGRFELNADSDRFLAVLVTPRGAMSVDETGRLAREPLKGRP